MNIPLNAAVPRTSGRPTAAAKAFMLAAGIAVFSVRPALAQDTAPRAAFLLDTLLAKPGPDSVLQALGDLFTRHFTLLVPDLTSEEAQVLEEAVRTAFDPPSVRAAAAEAIAGRLGPEVVERVWDMMMDGAGAGLDGWAAPDSGPDDLSEFASSLTAEDRPRLQIMVALVEAKGQADFPLILDEAARRVAHDVVSGLGGALPPFEPISDEQFEVGYRQETMAQGVASMHRYRGVPDSLVLAAIEEYRSSDGVAWLEAWMAGTLEALRASAEQVAALATPTPDDGTGPEVGGASGLPCMGTPCGFIVDWNGPPPSGINRRFGSARELEMRVLRHMVSMGFVFERREVEAGMTVRLVPRLTTALCEVTAGWYNTGCAAVGEVRIEFLGVPEGYEPPDRVVVRNRCGANGIMAIEGISAYVALHLRAALSPGFGFEDDIPNC